jgi:hypothetical protein
MKIQERNMKLSSGALISAMVAAAVATGCSETPRRYTEIRPSIDMMPVQTMQAGETRRITIRTENLVGAQAISWSVSPDAGRISPEQQAHGQSAIFTSEQPGTYVISASADLGNGRVVSDQTTVTVHGRPITSDRINEPMVTPAPGTPR